MKIDLNQIKNIAKNVSKDIANTVEDKYLEIKANNNFDNGQYNEVIKTANEILKLDKFNYEMTILKAKSLMKQKRYDDAIDCFIDAYMINEEKIEPALCIAKIHELQSNYDDAIEFYKSALRRDNDNIDALIGLARNSYIKKDYDNTIVNFDNAYSIDENILNDEDYFKWGMSLKELGKFKKAKKKFEHANRLNPSDKYHQEIKNIKNEESKFLKDEAYYNFKNNNFNNANDIFNTLRNTYGTTFTHEDYYTWGLCLEKIGDESKAYKMYKRAYARNKCEEYYNKIDSIEAKRKKEKEKIKNEAKEILITASEFFKNQDYKNADINYSKAFELESGIIDHEDYFNWGICLINLGYSSSAKEKFKKANNLKPCSKYENAYNEELLNSSNTFLILKEANIYFNERNYRKSLKYVDKALDLDSTNMKGLLLKGNILFEQGNPDCKMYYEKVLRISPNNKKAKVSLNAQRAIEDLQNPETVSYWLNKGYTHRLKGNYLNAIDAVNKAIEIDPDDWYAWSELCVAYENIKDYPKALDAINQSLELNSDIAQSWFNKGDTLFWMGDFEPSIICFDKAIKLDPNECDDALAIKGMALIRLNRTNEAKMSLRKSLENNPKNEFALKTIQHIPDFIDTEITMIDYAAASKLDVNPIWYNRIKNINSMVEDLQAKRVDIKFEFSSSMTALLTYKDNEYFFEGNEVDGAMIYVTKLWENRCN